MEWISVKERMPKDGEKVYAHYYDGHAKGEVVAWHHKGTFTYGYYAMSLPGVKCWQPLPSPPEGA